VGDENMVNPLDALKERSQNSDLRAMLDSLEPREAEIIRLRFGFDGYDEMTLEEVGKKFKVTRERIRQLQNIALSKIRKAIAKNEAQRSADEIELDERQRKRMEVIKEFIESKSSVPALAADRN
jgi:RNA polymerase primary sigma factor